MTILNLQEQMDAFDDIDKLDAGISDDAFENAAYYDIEENVADLTYTVTLYDDTGAAIATVSNIEDYDNAAAYLEEEFGIEVIDHDDVDDEAQAASTGWGHA